MRTGATDLTSPASLSLTDGAAAVERTAAPLGQLPRLSLGGGTLRVGDCTSAADREESFATTVGSQDWLWSGDDEIRFARATGELHSLHLKVPQLRPEAAEPTAPWAGLPVTTGGLRLDPPRPFSLTPARDCWISAGGTVLSARYDTPAPRHEALRLRVAPSCDLVFSDGRLAGWLLEQPERCLVTAWEVRTESPPDPELATILRDFLPYLAEPLVDRITDDSDPQLLTELRALEERARLRTTGAGRADALAAAVRDLIDDWY
jgi:hypothetical protein